MRPHRRGWRALLTTLMTVMLLVAGVLPQAAPAHASSLFRVTSTADTASCPSPSSNCTLRGALAAAVDGDVIIFDVSGTIAVGSPLTIAHDVFIFGPGAGSLTLDGQNTTRVFSVSSGADVTFSGLTITRGKVTSGGGGGILVNGATTDPPASAASLAISDSVLSNNSGAVGAGAIENLGTLSVTNSTFSGNSGTGGGAINNTRSLTVVSSTFVGNTAQSGGAIATAGTATVTNSTFSANVANPFGGALWNGGGGTLTVKYSTLGGNTGAGGSGVYNVSGTMTLRSTILSQGAQGLNCVASGGVISSLGDNVSGDSSCFATPNSKNDNINTAPRLATLALNSPGTTQTFALLPDSPAIDGVKFNPADCGGTSSGAITVDQRGVTRPQNLTGAFCDIGAYEATTVPPAIDPISAKTATAGTASNPIPVKIYALNGQTNSLTLTGTSANQAFVKNVDIVPGGSGGSRNVIITPQPQAEGPVDITLTVSDGTQSSSTTFTVNITGLNDPPVNTAPTSQTMNRNTTLTFVAGTANEIKVSDADAGTSDVRVKLTATNGKVTLGSTANLAIAGGANNSSTVTITGAMAALNAALNGLTYTPTPAYSGSASLEIVSNDLGHTGDGPAPDVTATVAITIVAANDPPVNKAPASRTMNEDTTLTFQAGTANEISVSDVDAGTSDLQVKLTATNGKVTLGSTANLAIAGGANNSSTVTITGPLTALNAALNGLTYTPTPNYAGSASLQIVSNDLGHTGPGPAPDVTTTVTITVQDVADPNIYHVTSTADTASCPNPSTNCTLRGALAAVVDGDLITFDVTGTISVGSTLVVSRSVTIQGPGAGSLTLDGNNSVRVFQINAPSQVTMSGLTIRRGNAGSDAGGGINNQGTLALTDMVMGENHADSAGGGAIENGGSLTVTRSTFTGNVAGGGGAIDGFGPLKVVSSTFVANRADAGGAIANAGPDATIVNSTFSDNVAESGGALWNGSGVTTTVSYSTLIGHDSTFSAGSGLVFAFGGTVRLRSTILVAPRRNCGGLGTFEALGNNISDDTNCFADDASKANLVTSTGLSRFGPLTVNAPGTTPTHALLTGNPAINGVTFEPSGCGGSGQDAVTTDQRGVARPKLGHCDVGAYEAESAPPAIDDVGPRSTPKNTPLGPITLTLYSSDGKINSLTVTASSSNPGLVSVNDIALTGSGGTRSMTIKPMPDQDGATLITLTVSDGTLSSSTSFELTVTGGTNDAPVNTVPVAVQKIEKNQTLVFSAANANAISVFDSDAGTSDIRVGLTASHGTLTLSGTTDLRFITGGNNTSTMVVEGAQSALNTALSGLTYAPTTNYVGTDTLQVTTDDRGNSGSGGSKQTTSTVAIEVTAGNGPPTISAVTGSTSTPEDTPTNDLSFTVGDLETAVGALVVTAESSNLTLVPVESITLGGTDANRTVTIKPALNQIGTADIKLTVKDSGDKKASTTFTLTVTAVNDAPVNKAPTTVTATEETPFVFQAGTANEISVSDVDAGTDLVQVALTATGGTVSLNGLAGLNPVGGANGTTGVTVQGTLASLNSALNGLTFTPAPNNGTGGSLQITTDDLGHTGAGTLPPTTSTIAITINGTNDAPSIGSVSGATTTTEDKPITVAFTVDDPDGNVGSLALTASSNDLTLVPLTNVVFGGSGANRTATITPAANQSGTVDLTFTVSDGTLSASTPYTLTVTAENDAPVNDVPTITQQVDRNATLVFSAAKSNQIKIVDVDAVAGPLAVKLTATGGTVTLNSGLTGVTVAAGANGSPSVTLTGTLTALNNALNGLTFTPTPNSTGPASLEILTNDQGNSGPGGAKSDTDTIAIQVNVFNASATISPLADLSTPEDTPTAAIPFTVGSAEAPPSGLVVTATSGNQAVVPNSAVVLSGSGAARSLQITPASNQSGAALIDVAVSNGTTTAHETFVLTVVAVNDSPVALGESYTVDAGQTLTVPVAAGVLKNDSDVDSPSLQAQVVNAPAHGSLTLNPDGSFGYTPASSFAGTDTFTYRASACDLTRSSASPPTIFGGFCDGRRASAGIRRPS